MGSDTEAMDVGGRVVAPAMVGRATELALLTGTVSAPPAVVSIEGEAGVGKSRLVAELLAGPAVASRRILVGRCHPIRESFPLGPVVDALGRAGEALRGQTLTRAAGSVRPLVPELAPWLPAAPEPSDDRMAQRHLMFRGLAEVLTVLSPAVLVLEDLHWVDENTADFVAYLLDCVPSGLTLVLTYRGEEADARVRAFTAKRPPGAAREHVTLSTLDETQTGELAAAILGADQVSAEFTRYLWERTSGLPFAVEELLALVRERGLVVRRGNRWTRRSLDQLEVPRSIRDSAVERVARLPAGAQRLVEGVALLQAPAPLPVLAALTGPDRLDGDDLIAALDAAISHGVLVEAESGFGFRHVLAAQAVHDNLNPARRLALHGRAAQALQALSPPPLGRIAHHLRHAGRPAEWATAAERAAAQAATLGGEDEAVRLLADVLRHAELPARRRASVAVALGWAALDTLHAGEVITPLRAVLDLEPPGEVRGELRFLLAVSLGQAGEDVTAQRENFLAALPELAHRPDLRAWAMVGLGVTVPPEVPIAEAVRWMTTAVDLVDRIDDPLLTVFVLGKAAASLMEIGDRSWRAAAEQVVTLTDSAPRQRREVNAYYSIGVAASYIGHLKTAETMLTAGLRAEAAQQNLRLTMLLRSGLAVQRFCAGRWEGLAAEVTGALGEVADYATSRMDLELVAGGLALARGEFDRAETLLRDVTERAIDISAYEVVPLAAGTWARAALARGDTDGALAGVRILLGILDAKGVWAPAGWALPVAVEALVAAGRAAEANQLTERAARELHGLDAPLAAPALAYARGWLGGQPDELLAAAEQYGRLLAGYESARAREAAGALLLASGNARRAVPVLRDAALTYDRLHASWDADRIAGLARRHGVSLPARYRGGRRGYGTELSPRERQVAELAARGRTNKEIASALFVSVFTVDKHMAAVMRKMRAGSRTDLVRLLAEAGEK